MKIDMLSGGYEYSERRKIICSMIKNKYKNFTGSLLVVAGFERECALFCQDSTFQYLVGIDEPALVLYQLIDGDSILYEPCYGGNRDQWVAITYDEEILSTHGIVETKSIGDVVQGYSLSPFVKIGVVRNLIDKLLHDAQLGNKIFTVISDASYEVRFFIEKIISLYPQLCDLFIDISDLIASVRRVKNQQELEYMYHAVEITILSHHAAAGRIVKGIRESDVQAAIEYIYTENCVEKAFPSIIASGKNGTILHYTKNNSELCMGDLVVVDIGASFQHYCADLTRTYPVSGNFSSRQKEIYDIVLKVQEHVAQQVAPGFWLNNAKYPEKSLQHIAIKKFEEYGYAQYFLHSIGHFIGLDTHDVGDISEPLMVGDVITIEPGIYIREESIGVRIEDMYWVVADGVICLSDELPKTVYDIELFMKKAREELL